LGKQEKIIGIWTSDIIEEMPNLNHEEDIPKVSFFVNAI
jgi:hypothetical protein